MDTTTKTCTKCGEDKPLTEYYKDKTKKMGVSPACKSCKSYYDKCRHDKNRETLLKYMKDYHWKNRDKILSRKKIYREENSEKIFEYRKENSASSKEYQSEYYLRNKGKFQYKSALRRSNRLKATPPWLTPEQKALVENLYKFRANVSGVVGREYHVDHIVPLQSEVVCGLHVPWNLQVIPAKDNLSKSNSTDHLDTLV